MPACPVHPSQFGAVLRTEGHPQWQQAYDWLVGLMRTRTHGRMWPRVRGMRLVDERSLPIELADDFCFLLLQHPRMLNAQAVESEGAIRTQVTRFLLTPTSRTIEVAVSNLKDHLGAKILEVLRSGSYLERRKGVWARTDTPDRTATAADLHRLRDEQPPLSARWQPQRSGQDPPVVSVKDLAAHLQDLFVRLQAGCTVSELCDLVWEALRPPAVAAVEFIQQADTSGPGSSPLEQFGVVDQFMDFDILPLLNAFLTQFDARSLSVLRLKLDERTEAEIGQTTGLSQPQVRKRWDQVVHELAQYLQACGYGASDWNRLEYGLKHVLGGLGASIGR